MKRCLVCNAHYQSSIVNCPGCGSCPELVDGFVAYAPKFSHGGAGFNSSYFADLAKQEENNFWFTSRNRQILWALEKYCHGLQSFLEVGCGTGYVLSGIAQAFPHAVLHGSEIFTAGLSFASARLPSADLMQMDARHIPFADEFDAIGAFDVLEHIEEDEQVLAQMHAALRTNGIMLLTVPQHAWLWSAVDERACHVRRYAAADLHRKVEAAGFQILRSTSFVTSLLPAMMASRLIQGKKTANKDARAELTISPWLNVVFTLILRVELVVIRMGFNFPLGGSRLVVARKIFHPAIAEK